MQSANTWMQWAKSPSQHSGPWLGMQGGRVLLELIMGDSTKNFMRQFKNEYYADDNSVELFPRRGDPEYIQIADPITLASFVAFCSRSNRQVVLRGGTDNYQNSVPSLFRDTQGNQYSMSERKLRWRAYRCLLTRLGGELSGTRWTDSDDLGAVLQHYGIKTPWLDVVRNLYTAIWFATHDLETRDSCRVAQWSERQYGWVSFYQQDEVNSLRVCDLWGEHSSRHIRRVRLFFVGGPERVQGVLRAA